MAICLPYAEGVALLKALEHAERTAYYSDNDGVEFKTEALAMDFHIIKQKEYREKKMMMLLGVDADES